jgi:hypothetical protein
MFSEQGISAVPIVDENGKVLNLYETVDVIVSVEATRSALGIRKCAHDHDIRPSSEMVPTSHLTSPLLKHSSNAPSISRAS